MDVGMYQAVRGFHQQRQRFETIANNLANAGTVGFKKDVFSIDEGHRERTRVDLSPGGTRHTNNPLDLALEGEGFFEVETAFGRRFTRNGNFSLNAQGVLVNQNGDPVLGERGRITLEGDDIRIDASGEVVVNGESVDRLSVVAFDNVDALRKEGLNRYTYNEEQGQILRAPEEVRVQQGYLEQSNVIVVEEMVRMVEALRAYESFQKVLQSLDEANLKSINEVGKLQA